MSNKVINFYEKIPVWYREEAVIRGWVRHRARRHALEKERDELRRGKQNVGDIVKIPR